MSTFVIVLKSIPPSLFLNNVLVKYLYIELESPSKIIIYLGLFSIMFSTIANGAFATLIPKMEYINS